MEGVFFAISGYQNPLRGQIRELGLEMGARYRPDWDSSCTHLVIDKCYFSKWLILTYNFTLTNFSIAFALS